MGREPTGSRASVAATTMPTPAVPPSRANAAETSVRAWTALGLLILGYVAVDVLAGAPRSPLVPTLPAGVGIPRWAGKAAGWLRLDRLGPVGSVVVSILVLAFLLVAFGVLAWEAWRRRLGVRIALIAVVAALGLSIAAPLLLSRDVYSYAAYGRTLSVHHASPYEAPPAAFPGDPFTPVVSREWLNTRSVYGPAFMLASAAITRIWSKSPSATILAFKAFSAVGILFAAAFAGWTARRAWPGRESLAVILVGLNPVVVVHTVGGGHNDAVVAGLLAVACLLGYAALSSVRTAHVGGPGRLRAGPLGGLALGATFVIAIAASVKVVAVLPLVYWWWTLASSSGPGARTRVIGTHLGVAVVATAALTAPVFAGWRTVTAIVNLASRQGWASGARLVARGGQGVGRSMGGASLGTAFGIAVYAAFLALFAFLAWRLHRTRAVAGPADLWGSSLLLLALAAPYLLPWYTVWFLPFLAMFSDPRLGAVGLVVAGLLALTGVPAEPALDPGVWRAMTLGVHYAVAPVMLALFAYAAKRTMSDRPGRFDATLR